MKKAIWLHLLAAFVVAKLIFHLLLNAQWSFHRDELLYLALGRHLDWGYASVPAGIGFWAWFGDQALGGSVWAIRLISTLIGCGTVWLTGLMAREMLPAGQAGSGKFAMLLVGLAGLTCGAFLRPCMLFMPVVFDVFYWALLSWLFLRYLNTGRAAWLLWFGAATGLALLNKYSVLIFLFAMLPGLLLSAQRRVFREKNLYLAMGLALLIFAPNIVWQAQRGFPVFQHMSQLAASQFVNVTLGSFFGDQIRFFLPALPVWLCGLYFLLFEKTAAQWRIFGLMYLSVLAVLLFFSAKSYYSLGAYPVLIAAGAAFWENRTSGRLRWVRVALPAFMLSLGAMVLPAALPLFPPEKEADFAKNMAKIPGLQGLLRWEDGNYYALPQDFADMLGWQEIADMTGRAWQNVEDKPNAAIYADNYGMAGAIEHFGKKYAVPPVLSFSDNYRYWLPDALPGGFKTLLYVNDELGDDMPVFFEKIELVDRLDMPLSRQHGVSVFRCENPKPAFFHRINEAIRRARSGEEID
jgi:4-amino-4-deoxy-L-arabinose transferase-like glycosyltransferase